MAWIPTAAVVVFLLVLLGQYAYREAREEGRTSPALRGLFWPALGVLGAASYLVNVRERGPRRLGWLAVSLLFGGFWAIGAFGLWGVRPSFYSWGYLFGSLFVLYWQFVLEAPAFDVPSVGRGRDR